MSILFALNVIARSSSLSPRFTRLCSSHFFSTQTKDDTEGEAKIESHSLRDNVHDHYRVLQSTT